MSINKQLVEDIGSAVFQILLYHHPTKIPLKISEDSKLYEIIEEKYKCGVNNIEGIIELESELRRIVPKRGQPLSKKLFNWVHSRGYNPNSKQVMDEIYNIVSKTPKMFPALYDILKKCGYTFKKAPKA